MNEAVSAVTPLPTDGRVLRAALTRARTAIAAIPPVLAHLVGTEPQGMLDDEAIARTRGMIESLALELAREAGLGDLGLAAALVNALVEQPALLGHCHALAIEFRAAERAAAAHGVDPVLSPLLQDRIADADPAIGAAAMELLAAQARFVLVQRRMEIATGELPAELLHDVLAAFVGVYGAAAHGAAARVRDAYSEVKSRATLLSRVILGIDNGWQAALDPAHAGVALFLTALSLATGEDRTACALALAGGQEVRLALLLAAAGAEPARIEAVLRYFHPDAAIPPAYCAVDGARAQELLAEGART